MATRTIPVRLEADLIEQIDHLAQADDRPRSAMIRRLVLEAVAARESKDGATPDPA